MGYLAGSAASLLQSGVKQVILSSYLNSLASDWEGAAELGTHKAGIGHLFLERFSSPCSLPAYVCSVWIKARATLAYVWMVGASVSNLIWAKLILRMCLMLAKTFEILWWTVLQKTNLITNTSSQFHGFSFSRLLEKDFWFQNWIQTFHFKVIPLYLCTGFLCTLTHKAQVVPYFIDRIP